MARSGPWRAGVVGAGTRGRLSIAALAGSPRFDVVAIADSSPAALRRIAAEHPGVALFASPQEMFTASRLDVACVSTYAPTHLPITVAALEHGVRGLLVEKPLGATTAEGRAVLDRAAARRVPLVVPHGLMAMSAPLEIVERIRGGDLGELRFVEIECTGWDIINAGIHWLQFFVAVTEEDPAQTVLTACDTSTRTFRDGMQVETEAVTLVRTAAGVRLFMNTGDDIPLARGGTPCLMRFIGSDGVLEYGAWESGYTTRIAGRPPETVEVEPFEVSGHRRHLEHLADLMDGGRTDDRIPAMSLRALELVEAAYLSHRRRATVRLPRREPPDASGMSTSEWIPGTPHTGSGGGRDGRAV